MNMEIWNECDISLYGNDSVCRVCLSSNEENKCILTFQMCFENRNSTGLLAELQLFGGIEVKHGDGLPSKICDNCIANLRIAHDFRAQCQESDKKLRSLIEKVRNEYLSYGNKREFVANEEQRSAKLYDFDEACGKILTASVENPERINEDRGEFCKNAIDGPKILAKNPATEADQRQAQRLTTLVESDTWNSEEPWKICTELVSREKSWKVTPKSMVEKSLATNRTDRRSKRLIAFRGATLMENLRNRREQQRRHVKKAMCTENSRNNNESPEAISNCRVSAQEPSDLETSLYECTKCCRSYESKRSLDEHRLSHESDRYSCDRCDQRFENLVEFVEHAKSHDSKDKLKPARCKICDKNFRKTLTMVRHLHVHKRENPRAVYAILKDMRDKRKKGTSMSSIAPTFGEKSTQKSTESLEDAVISPEIRSNTDEFSNSSRACGSSADSEIPSDDTSVIKLINIWIREELDSENEGKSFSCDICNKSYVSKKSLLSHVSKMHAGASRCNVCREHCACADKSGESDKSNEVAKYRRCRVCEKSFEKETKLEQHMKIHARGKDSEDENFKRFLCHICSKTFRLYTGLMFHMRTHTGYKPHVCKYCGRGFTSNSNCINHERTHTGDRPFVCHFCSAAFAKSCTLKAHITTHTREANYHCKTCGKSFTRLKYLKEHRFTHTGEKPYGCKMCGTAYSHSGSLFVHAKKCKAQYGNRQGSTNNYGDDGSASIRRSEIDGPVNPDGGDVFVDGLQRIDQIDVDIRSNHTNVGLSIRSFTSNGQVFQA